jgi:glyoxylase-like metal-dependent hydrolase (beta-lactamase superfamily II)
MATRLYVFSSGTLKSTKSKFALEVGVGEPFEVPVPYFLLDVDGTKVLIDAGNSPGVVEDPRGTWGNIIDVYYPVMSEEQKPVNALAALGIQATDVDYILISHLHLDHAGSLRAFPKAKVIVQLPELRYAFFPDPLMAAAYIDADFKDPAIQWEPIVGLKTLFDGAVVCLPTYGHTPGHQSFLVRLEDYGPVLITSDAVYLRQNLEEGILPGLAVDFAQTQHSVEAIKDLAQAEGAEIWVGHDPEAFEELKLAPEYYS